MGGAVSHANETEASDDQQSPTDAPLSDAANVFTELESEQAASTQNLVPTEFRWKHGGYAVYVTGSWDDWKDQTRLSHTTPAEFGTVLALCSGTFQYKFIVDGIWRHSTSLPTIQDSATNVNNVITITQQNTEHDCNGPLNPNGEPTSPEVSYDYSILPEEDHTTEPPALPRILASAPIDRKSRFCMTSTDFVRLNHIFTLETELVCGSTAIRTMAAEVRFKDKVVTTILVTTKRRSVQREAISQHSQTSHAASQPIPIRAENNHSFHESQSLGESQSLLLDALNNV